MKLRLHGGQADTGRFVEIEINAAGRGAIHQDEFGLAPLYIATEMGFSFVANQSDLIAQAIHRFLGKPPQRDRAFSALLTFRGFPMGDRTGFRGIRAVPFRAHVQVGSRVTLIPPSSQHPWVPLAPESSDLVNRAVDELENSAAATIRHAARTAAGRRPRLELTGGRDSRLVLALAIRSGAVDRFEAVTYTGRADDVRIAGEVAQSARVHSLAEDRPPVTDDPFERVGTTSGALSLSEACRAWRDPPATVLTGFFGESLSSHFPFAAPPRTRGSVLAAFIERPNLDLLTEPAWIEVVATTMQLLMEPLAHGANIEDVLDAFYIQHRIRRWFSVRPEAFRDTVFPLYCPAAVRLAFAMGWQGRTEHPIHDALVERAGRGIAGHSYASAKRTGKPSPGTMGYPEAGPPILDMDSLRRIAGAWRGRRPRFALPNAAANPDPNREGAALAARHASPAKLDLYRDIAADAQNPAFEVIDRPRLLATLDVLPILPSNLAKQVYAAMTSVIWLGEMETT
ncbi:MAG: hypothetical protein OXI55_10315 [Gammaproteobacteria bacterium]|nr:hypothetical protein [Gammaproteobacteria bacterium]